MRKKKAKIGILGGMGPEASAVMLEVLISMAVKEFGARKTDDFPEIILDSVPVPDFIANKSKLVQARKMLKDRVRNMNKLNVTSMAMACNTAHILFDDLNSIADSEFVSMIEAVAESVDKRGIKKVGLLATPMTIKLKLFEKALCGSGISLVLPNRTQTDDIERIIRCVIKGSNNKTDSNRLRLIADSLKRKGAQGIILGCTEIPLVFPKKFSLPIFNSIEITAKKLLTVSFDSKINKV